MEIIDKYGNKTGWKKLTLNEKRIWIQLRCFDILCIGTILCTIGWVLK